MKRIQTIDISKVTLLDEYYVNASTVEVDYLLSLKADRLLAGFRETAGLPMKAPRYGGWENMLIGGHTLGHYLTAVAQAYASATTPKEDKAELLSVLSYIMEELKACQDALGNGFIFGATIPNKDNLYEQFDMIEAGKCDIIKEAWVPWYTMHKIIAGLVSVASLAGDEAAKVSALALSIVSDLSDWCYARTQTWDEKVHRTVLNIEYGGMNDCLFDVFALTGKEEHKKAALMFEDAQLYDRVKNGKAGENVLTNVHANTTIPKFIGVMKHYLVLGGEEYLAWAAAFFNMVNENHTYMTGGNSQWEHFRVDGALNADRTSCNCETCNAYNMLKLVDMLYRVTGDLKYADWYENTFINSVLSSQNPGSGMTTYFQPMATGCFKTFSNEFNKFWCCTGSGMENFTKLATGMYYAYEGALIVNRYVSSRVEFDGTKLLVEAGLAGAKKKACDGSVLNDGEVMLTIENACDKAIVLRIPGWCAAPSVKAPGHTVKMVKSAGELSENSELRYGVTEVVNDDARVMLTDGDAYAVIEGPFAAGEKILLGIPARVTAFCLPDSKATNGFKYGPYVLAALLGSKDMVTTMTGVAVTITEKAIIEDSYVPSESDAVQVTSGDTEEFLAHIDKYMIREDSENLRFRLQGTDSNLVFVPHFSQFNNRFGLYFTFGDVPFVTGMCTLS